MNKTIELPSGAKLHITLPPMSVSKALLTAVIEEARALKISATTEIDVNLFKDLFCTGFSSPKIETALNECFKRVTYNGIKITDDTWESVEARGDYLIACYEVAKENITPFLKSLFAQYGPILEQLKSGLK